MPYRTGREARYLSVSTEQNQKSKSLGDFQRVKLINLREPDSTTLWYLQIGPEVEKIR